MDIELRSRTKSAGSGRSATGHFDDLGYSQDDRDLIRLGKKPVLKVALHFFLVVSFNTCFANTLQRNFGFMSILGFSCTVLITWEGILMFVMCIRLLIHNQITDSFIASLLKVFSSTLNFYHPLAH
jgi:apolipoprotein N-acyltransferase